METLGILLAVLAFASMFWAIAGLITPRVLFFAIPEKKTRFYASIFPIFFTVLCIAGATVAIPETKGSWAFLIVMLFVVGGAVYHVRTPNPPMEEAGKAERARGNTPLLHVCTRDDLPEHELEELDRETEAHFRKMEEREWKEDWFQTLGLFLGRPFDSKEETVYRRFFGGDNECRFNLCMFHSRSDETRAWIHAPKDNYYRKRYDTLVATGAVLTGEHMTIADRVALLSMEEVRRVADIVGADRKKKKQEMVDGILAKNADAVLRACMQVRAPVSTDDHFLFDRERIIAEVNRELGR